MSPFDIILLTLTGNVVLLGVLGFLAKSLISQFLAKDIERFKSSLIQASSSATEELKHQLNLTAHEHGVRFARLHEKQAHVIETIYAKLLDFEDASAVFSLVSENMPADLIEPALRRAENTRSDISQYIRHHEIHLPSALSEQLAAMLNKISELLSNCSHNVISRRWSPEDPSALFPEAEEAWSQVNSYLEHESPAVRRSLEGEFRKLLGTEAKDA